METAKVVVGNLATVFTIINYASGIQICRNIYAKGNTIDVSPLPFLAGILTTFIWLQYGVKKEDNILMWVNSIGLLLQLSFLICFHLHTKLKRPLHLKMFTLAAILAAIFCEVNYVVKNKDTSLNILGFIGCAAALFFFSSPLATVAQVVRSQSTESLPFPLILSAFLVSSLWTLYGVLCDDVFIYVPNFMGALITSCQLALFLIYPSASL